MPPVTGDDSRNIPKPSTREAVKKTPIYWKEMSEMSRIGFLFWGQLFCHFSSAEISFIYSTSENTRQQTIFRSIWCTFQAFLMFSAADLQRGFWSSALTRPYHSGNTSNPLLAPKFLNACLRSGLGKMFRSRLRGFRGYINSLGWAQLARDNSSSLPVPRRGKENGVPSIKRHCVCGPRGLLKVHRGGAPKRGHTQQGAQRGQH